MNPTSAKRTLLTSALPLSSIQEMVSHHVTQLGLFYQSRFPYRHEANYSCYFSTNIIWVETLVD